MRPLTRSLDYGEEGLAMKATQRTYALDDLGTFARARTEVQGNGCWHWTTGLRPSGYAYLPQNRRGEWGALAHRYVYWRTRGPIPAGFQVDHECHNRDLTCMGGPTCLHRRCVNPNHPLRARDQNAAEGDPVRDAELGHEIECAVWDADTCGCDCNQGQPPAPGTETRLNVCTLCGSDRCFQQECQSPAPGEPGEGDDHWRSQSIRALDAALAAARAEAAGLRERLAALCAEAETNPSPLDPTRGYVAVRRIRAALAASPEVAP